MAAARGGDTPRHTDWYAAPGAGPGLAVPAFLAPLLIASGSIAVLMLTMYHDEDTVFAALRAGGKGYVLKGDTQHDLTQAIRSVAAGHVTLGPGAAERLLGALAAGPQGPLPFPELTERERQVLELLADGHANAAIGRTLGLASKTVANHVSNILTKLHVTDRAQASIEARRVGLGRQARSPHAAPPPP